MERFFRFFRFRRSADPPKQEIAVPPPPPVPSSESERHPVPPPPPPAPVPTPEPEKKSDPTPPVPSCKSKEAVACRPKESQRPSREAVGRTVSSKEKPQLTNREKLSRQQPRSKEPTRKSLSKETPVNKRSRTSSAEKVIVNRKSVSTPERPTQQKTPVPPRTCTTEMSGEKTTDVDPGQEKTRDKTVASECEKRTVDKTVASEAEKRQTGVKKANTRERTSMRRRMKDAAMASSRQIRRASNSLTDSAKKLSNFVSRPIKERSLNDFMERVKQRNERRKKQSSDSMQLRPSEDAFPTSNSVCADDIANPPGPPTERSEKSDKSEKSEKDRRRIGNKDADKIFPDLGKDKSRKSRSGSGSKASKRSFLSGKKRKPKENEIFGKDGKPFWVRAGKITQEEKNEITQDDLPLNAEVIVDVKNGKIDLPCLSNVQFKFDAYAPMETLRERDKVFFTHKMLFANTIRSMINTADETKTDTDNNNTDAERTVEKKTECDDMPTHKVKLMPHPKYCTNYNRAVPGGKLNREPFEYTGKGVV